VSTVDEKRIEGAARRDALAARQADEDLKAVMGTQQGRRVMWRLLHNGAGLYEPSFTGEGLSSAYNEGRRSVGLKLMLELQRVDERAYIDMMSEALADARVDATLKEAEGS